MCPIASNEKSSDEIVAIIAGATGKPDLEWLERTYKEELDGMLAAGIPEETDRNCVEMGTALRLGDMNADDFCNRPMMAGWRKFNFFLTDLKAVCNAG